MCCCLEKRAHLEILDRREEKDHQGALGQLDLKVPKVSSGKQVEKDNEVDLD